MKILLSAFGCDPTKGSEEGNGWNWAIGLANKGFEVHCFTREIGRANIVAINKQGNLKFYFLKLPLGLEKLYSYSQASMYCYYILWQLLAYFKARSLDKQVCFNLIHHVSWGSPQLGSFLYKLNKPFVFGPAGGGQFAPDNFKDYFGDGWHAEVKRAKVSKLLRKFNPAYKKMIIRSSAVWVNNQETEDMVKETRKCEVFREYDGALPINFFPENFTPKKCEQGILKLLWVGRFMPRKGVLLVLDVMATLKKYPKITLTIVGDGEQRSLIESCIKEKELESTVFLVGKVPHLKVREFYNTNDVFLFTSLRDSCPSQLFEAMAYGMPVVTLNLHGQGSIVNNDTGIRCNCLNPVDTVKELSNAILKLYNNPALVSNMSRSAYDFAKKQTWNNKIEKVVSVSYKQRVSSN